MDVLTKTYPTIPLSGDSELVKRTLNIPRDRTKYISVPVERLKKGIKL